MTIEKESRVGDIEPAALTEAIETLQTSDSLARTIYPNGHPFDAAFLALCHHRRGSLSEAQSELARLEGLAKDSLFADDPQTAALLDEVRQALSEESSNDFGLCSAPPPHATERGQQQERRGPGRRHRLVEAEVVPLDHVVP